MSVSSVSNNLSIQDLAARLTARFDANKDGQLSVSEFANVMTTLLGAASPASTVRASGTAAAALGRPAIGVMAGFDATKLADTTHTSFKYQIGRILQGFQNTPQGLRDALPQIQQLVPGAQIAGTKGDKLDFGTYQDPKDGLIGVVDVLQGAGLGGVAWQWMPVAS